MKTYYLSLIFALWTGSSLLAKDYKGAELYSNNSYLYGRFEMSIKAAEGSGILSTFFLYRNDSETNSKLWEEIDIEIFGKDTNSYQTNIITEKTEGIKQHSELVHRPKLNLHKDFHKYVLEWTPDYIAWYLNDVEIRRDSAKNNPQVAQCKDAMSIRFNTWASESPEWVGTFDTRKLPQTQYVNYLKYYEYTPNGSSKFTLKWTDEFTSIDNARWSKANWTFGGNYVDFEPNNLKTLNGNLELWLTTTLSQPTALTDNVSESLTLVYPSPTHDVINIKSEEQITSIQLFDSIGNLKETFTTSILNIHSYSAGLYVLHINQGNKTTIHKIVKK